jgi:hypothetical protein
MMGYQSTSGSAYADMKGVIARKQAEVLRLLANAGNGSEGYNNRQISLFLGWPINTVTPRVLELREMGKVELAGRRVDPMTQRTTMFWKVAS